MGADMKILAISRDKELTGRLESEFPQTTVAESGPVGERIAFANDFDLIVLDQELATAPIMRTLRGIRQKRSTPVLMAIPQPSREAKLAAFEAGASACIVKPLDLDRLTRLIRLIVVRSKGEAHCNGNFSKVSLKEMDLRLARGVEKVELTYKERLLLKLFLFNKECILTRGMINRCLYPERSGLATSVIDTHLSNLRKKLEALNLTETIYTVRGSGYVLMA